MEMVRRSDADAACEVEVPEWLGGLARGATRPDALRHAEDALRFWLKTAPEDGREIPQPRGWLVYA